MHRPKEDRTAIGLSLAHAVFALDFRKETVPSLFSVSAHTVHTEDRAAIGFLLDFRKKAVSHWFIVST